MRKAKPPSTNKNGHDQNQKPTFTPQLPKTHWFYQTYQSEAIRKRTFSEKLADLITSKSGSMTFLMINAIWFTVWIVINFGIVPDIAPFDPYPFGFLTMVVSLEAIALAIIVLISQNREQKINSIREETLLQLDIITEKEITKALDLLVKIAKHNNIKIDDDRELLRMLSPTDHHRIKQKLEKEI